MKIALRFELDQRKFQESMDSYIDRIHDTFQKQMGDTLADSGPIETGEFRASWKYSRTDKHHSVISNNTPQARFLQGTGVYGPTGQPICARGVNKLKFYWRYFGYELFIRKCVKGINPHEVHGMPGQVYDFIEEMNSAIQRGWNKTTEAI